MTNSFWNPGTPILYREVWQGRAWTARPVRVVQDTPGLTVLYFCPGTRWMVPAGNRQLYFSYLQVGSWPLAEITQASGDTLYLLTPGAAYAVHVLWSYPTREFRGWYVNLQEPVRRTVLGFDFMDQELDIFVTPDWAWSWKDEDHFQRAQADGRYSPAQAQAIRAEGERVIAMIAARASPFRDGWERWSSPREWPIPELPEGWDRVAP